MKAFLLTVVVLCGAMGSVVAQKKSTVVGEIVIGELTTKDETTREITIKYRGKEGIETFSGFLGDGHKLRLADGTRRDLKLSEIALGTYVRLHYKTGREKISGQEKKINQIKAIDVLGSDEFFRVRAQLKLDPATAIAHSENDNFPTASPLKVHLASAYKNVPDRIVEWVGKWNRKNGDSLGNLEIVSDLESADLSLVVAPGADTMVAVFPMDVAGDEWWWSQATVYMIVNDAGHMKVLWTGVAPVVSSGNVAVSAKSTTMLIDQMEKRLKARARNPKKSSEK